MYRVANGNEPPLADGVIGIIESSGQGIIKHGYCFVKGHIVFSKISLGLFEIPLKLHSTILVCPAICPMLFNLFGQRLLADRNVLRALDDLNRLEGWILQAFGGFCFDPFEE